MLYHETDYDCINQKKQRRNTLAIRLMPEIVFRPGSSPSMLIIVDEPLTLLRDIMFSKAHLRRRVRWWSLVALQLHYSDI